MTTAFRPRWYFFAALVSITLIAPLTIHLFLPALPAVKADFGVSTGVAQLTLAMTMLTMAFVTVAYGGLSDRFGRKRVLLCGLVLFTCGAALCLAADSIPMLIAGRMVQGAGAGCGVVLARAIARDVYGLQRVTQAIAYLTAAYVMGPMIAPPLGGKLIDLFGWRALFVLATGVGFLVILAVIFIVPETRASALRKSGGGTLAGYASLLRQPRFVGFVLQPGFMSGAFFAEAATVPFLSIDVLKVPEWEFGLWFILFPLGYMAGNLISARIGRRAPVERMTMVGSVTGLLSALLMGVWLLLAPMTMPALFVPGFFLGIAQGLSLPYAQAGAMAVDPDRAGSASGATVFSQMFWPAVAQQVTGTLADGTWVPMVATMTVASLCALASAVVAIRAPRRGGKG